MPWNDNVRRLFGMHDLSGAEVAKLFDLTPQAVSEWVSKGKKARKRNPSLDSMIRVGALFEIDPGRLVTAEFHELMPDLGDRDRFLRIESRIRGANIRVVEDDGATVTSMDATRKANSARKARSPRKTTGKG